MKWLKKLGSFLMDLSLVWYLAAAELVLIILYEVIK